MNWSTEQTAIFTQLAAPTGPSLLVVASAGSGKTTTIVQGASLLPDWTTNRFLAFNKNIATELETRLPHNCVSSTFHSAGMNALGALLPKRPRVDAQKLNFLLRTILKAKPLFSTYSSPCRKLVGYAKNNFLRESCPSASWQQLIDHHGLTHEGTDGELIKFSQQLLSASVRNVSHIDFDDMLYLPIVLNAPFQRSPNVFVDEAQDTNPIQREMLSRMLATSGRLVAVGDPSQAIYGFRGASTDAMNELRTRFAMTVLPLSVSYRCSQSVVREAQPYDKGLTI